MTRNWWVVVGECRRHGGRHLLLLLLVLGLVSTDRHLLASENTITFSEEVPPSLAVGHNSDTHNAESHWVQDSCWWARWCQGSPTVAWRGGCVEVLLGVLHASALCAAEAGAREHTLTSTTCCYCPGF